MIQILGSFVGKHLSYNLLRGSGSGNEVTPWGGVGTVRDSFIKGTRDGFPGDTVRQRIKKVTIPKLMPRVA